MFAPARSDSAFLGTESLEYLQEQVVLGDPGGAGGADLGHEGHQLTGVDVLDPLHVVQGVAPPGRCRTESTLLVRFLAIFLRKNLCMIGSKRRKEISYRTNVSECR